MEEKRHQANTWFHEFLMALFANLTNAVRFQDWLTEIDGRLFLTKIKTTGFVTNFGCSQQMIKHVDGIQDDYERNI